MSSEKVNVRQALIITKDKNRTQVSITFRRTAAAEHQRQKKKREGEKTNRQSATDSLRKIN